MQNNKNVIRSLFGFSKKKRKNVTVIVGLKQNHGSETWFLILKKMYINTHRRRKELFQLGGGKIFFPKIMYEK